MFGKPDMSKLSSLSNAIAVKGSRNTFPGDPYADYPATDSILQSANTYSNTSQQNNQPAKVQGQFQTLTAKPMTDDNGDPILKAAQTTVGWEGRKDKDGHLAVYQLPAADGGGSYEVAGINEKYDPMMAEKLKNMEPSQRQDAATQYIYNQVKPFASQFPQPMQGFMADMSFNRGNGGSTGYIQEGLNALGQNVAVDGALGPKTLAAIAQVDPKALMRAASDAQWQHELRLANNNPGRKAMLPGLQNRIQNRLSTYI